MNKTTPIIGLLLVSCLLGGCHKNPLKTHSEEDNVAFLVEASVAATKVLHPDFSLSDGRRSYLNCMQNKWIKVDCTALYQAMTDFAKTKTFPEFKEVSVADLSDKTQFASVKDGYEELLFNSLEY